MTEEIVWTFAVLDGIRRDCKLLGHHKDKGEAQIQLDDTPESTAVVVQMPEENVGDPGDYLDYLGYLDGDHESGRNLDRDAYCGSLIYKEGE